MQLISADPHNYTAGRQGHQIKCIVIHSIVGSLNSCIKTFQDPKRLASAHYGVGLDGRVVQFVLDENTAWHAGNWNVNLESIGIEHEDNAKPYDARTDLLYQKSAELVAELCRKYAVPCDRAHIKKHMEVSSHATACPAGLDIDRIVSQAKAILEQVTTTKGWVSSGNPINMRMSPSLTGAVIDSLPAGYEVTLEKRVVAESVLGNNIWYLLTNGKYVWSGRISLTPPAIAVAPQGAPVVDKPTLPDTPPQDKTQAQGLLDRVAHWLGLA
jgi:hypothetical protein